MLKLNDEGMKVSELAETLAHSIYDALGVGYDQ